MLLPSVRLVALTPSRLIPVSVYLSANVDSSDDGFHDGIFFHFSPLFVNQTLSWRASLAKSSKKILQYPPLVTLQA